MIDYEKLALKTLITLIEKRRKNLPHSLEVPDVMKELNAKKDSVYGKLNRGEIPGAQKIPGIGWRVNTDIFLAWLCVPELEKKLSEITK